MLQYLSEKSRELLAIGTACVCLLLSACDQSDPAPPCLPPEIKSLLSQGQALQAPTQSNVQILFDGSGSMGGYLRARGSDIRPVPDIVHMLQAITSTRGDNVSFYQFGARFHMISVAQADRLADEHTYACGHAIDCDNQESHIDEAFERATQFKSGLTVIVTDLWLSSKDLSASRVVAINTQLSALFDDSRSIAILGLRAPYRGAIDDLPNNRHYNQETEHPLFVILAGPLVLVEAYRSEMLALHSPAFAPDRLREVLFTPTPFAFEPGDLKLSPVDARSTAALMPRAVLPSGYGAFQQFHVSHAAAHNAKGSEGAARMTVPLRKRSWPGAVWTGTFEGSAQIWLKQDNAPGIVGDRCLQWVKFKDLSGAWTPGSYEFTLNAKDDIALLPPGHTYLISASLKQTQLESPNPADQWMRDWSFTVANEDQLLVGRPAFFPTLNLEEMAAILEARLAESVASHQLARTGTVVGVRLDD